MNFWNNLLANGPVVGLSPMDGVTDLPMRYMTAKYGKPDVIFTEFVSVDGLAHAKQEDSVERLMSAFLRLQEIGGLAHYPYQVAQVFGHEPQLFYMAAVIVATLGYDGMDINMGCPAKNVSERGSGAGLIRTPEIAQEIVHQAKQGMQDFAEGKVTIDDLAVSDAIKQWVREHCREQYSHIPLPISVKTRIGVDNVVVREWMATLMEVEPAIISLHGRTLKQLYQGQADWEAIGEAAEVVHSLGGHLLGNGDVQSLGDGMKKMKMYGVDGFLIGRASEGNPAIFVGNDNPTWDERKAWMIEHAEIYEKVFRPHPPSLDELRQGTRNEPWFVPVRKHLAWYCKGFPGASELRGRLVRVNSSPEVLEIITSP